MGRNKQKAWELTSDVIIESKSCSSDGGGNDFIPTTRIFYYILIIFNTKSADKKTPTKVQVFVLIAHISPLLKFI